MKSATQAKTERDDRQAKVAELRSRLADREQQTAELIRRRRKLLLPAELGNPDAKADLKQMEPALEESRRETQDLTDILAEAEATLADLDLDVHLAEHEETLALLEAILADREKAARAVAIAMTRLVNALAKWDGLHTKTYALAAQAGFASPDRLPLQRAQHLTGSLLWALEQYLPPDVARPHRAFRNSFKDMDAQQVRIAREGAERSRKRLQARRPDADTVRHPVADLRKEETSVKDNELR